MALCVPASACTFDVGACRQTRPSKLGCSLVHTDHQSKFFNGGGSSLALRRACILPVGRSHGSGKSRGGGALGAQMNVFERMVRIVRSYVNAAVSAAEDPEKLLDQSVLEMNEDLVKLRQTTAQVLASQKQLENRYKQAKQNSEDWYGRAKLALQKGEEMLAKEALKRKKEFEDNATGLKTQTEQQKGVIDKLLANSRLLDSKIQEAKSKKDTLKARAQSARTSQKVNEMLGSINTSSALAAFERMEEKVTALEAESDALNELGTDDLSSKFAALESGDVDDDLAALRKEMLGSSKREGALPPGRYSEQSNPAGSVGVFSQSLSPKDAEIEKELNELRRQSRE